MNFSKIYPYPNDTVSIAKTNLIQTPKIYENITDYYNYLNKKKNKIDKKKIYKKKNKKNKKKINPLMETGTLPVLIPKTILPIITLVKIDSGNTKKEWTDEYFSDEDEPDEYNF